MAMEVVNPATGDVIERYEEMDGDAVQKRIVSSDEAFRDWGRLHVSERSAIMHEAALVLKSEEKSLADLMAREMGKPVRDGRAEIEKCSWLCRHYAERAGEMLVPEAVPTDARKSYVTFIPLGVVLGVMPWNYPFWQVFRFAVPALMAGNAVLLKPASNVPGCGLAVEAVMHKAGFPAPLFQTLLVSSRVVPSIVEHPRVRGVAFTGSQKAGEAVAGLSGKHLLKTVLELGGSDPYLILEDADLDEAAKTCAASRLLNSGQSCIAAKRFIVVEGVREAFEERLVAALQDKRMGDPLKEETDIGPQARGDLRDTLHRQVRRSIDAGARCLLGGRPSDGKGFYYPPTVLTGVQPGMAAFDEETFGPVAAVVPARHESEAVDLANHTDYGLGAAVFTRDLERGERIAAKELDAGNCFVNALVRSDPRLPFGGVKGSGFGRELSHYGIKEFVNIKTVYVG